MKRFRALSAVFLVISLMTLLTANSAGAATAPTLGDTASFAVLASSTVTNTGPSEVHGDLGVSPGTSVTGFPPGQLVPPTLSPHAGDEAAADAQSDLVGTYNDLDAEPCTQNLTGQDLGGLTLVPGVYCFDSSAFLTGTLTLNAVDGAASVFVFKTVSTLITASDSSVEFLGSGTCDGVYWKVGSSATLGTGSLFEGTIVALTSITATTGADVNGRLLALNGAVTLDDNKVTGPSCGIETEDGGEEEEEGELEPLPPVTINPSPTGTTSTDDTPIPPNPSTLAVGPGTPITPGTPLPTSKSAKLITTTHQQLVTTGMDVLPLGLSALTALLIGTGFLLESRRRTKKEQPVGNNIR
jgi:type VI secretion system secreted protein VgrG